MSALNATNASTNVTIGNEIIYVPFVISIFGLIGNAVAFLTIVLSDLRKNYVNIYLLVLLCSDSVLLLDFFFQPLFRFDVLNFWTCAMTEYLFNTPVYVSSFAMISLTAERFFCIVFPLQHLKNSQLSRWKIILVWLIPIFLFNFNLAFALENMQNSTVAILVEASSDVSVKCNYNYEASSAYILFYWPRLFFTFVLPLTVIVTANVIILFKIRSINIIQGKSTSTMSSEVKCNNIILFVIPIVFVALNLPYNLRNILKFVFNSITNNAIYEQYFAFISSTLYLYCFNFSVNFIIYAMTSSMFRKALVSVWYEPIKRRVNRTKVQKVQTMHIVFTNAFIARYFCCMHNTKSKIPLNFNKMRFYLTVAVVVLFLIVTLWGASGGCIPSKHTPQMQPVNAHTKPKADKTISEPKLRMNKENAKAD